MRRRRNNGLVCAALVLSASSYLQAAEAPAFKLIRYDENYAYLRDPAQRSDYLDAIKLIPLNTNGEWYLTLGGEIRERYEYYHNSLWGRGPQDTGGYLLERYMVQADAHFGEYF